MAEVVWINGHVHERADAAISVFDHGFLYGDSVYETVRTARGRPFLLDRHLHRLRNSAALIDVALDRDDAGYRRALDEALVAGANAESAIRIVVTRGVGDIGYDRNLCSTPNTLVYVRPMHNLRDPGPRRGVAAVVVGIRRNDRRAVSPAIKSGNLLNNILASHEAQSRGATEGIMLNSRGEVAEGSMTNIFIVRKGTIETPPLDAGILPGITRGFVLELAAGAGLPVRETGFPPDEILAADEAFLTGTTRGVVPIVTVDGQSVGDGRPGPLTLRLIELFDAAEDRIAAQA